MQLQTVPRRSGAVGRYIPRATGDLRKERACRAYQLAVNPCTRARLRATSNLSDAHYRRARSTTQQPTPLERLLEEIDELAVHGAPESDLLAFAVAVIHHVRDASGAVSASLEELIRRGNELEAAEDRAECLVDLRQPGHLATLADTKEREALTDLATAHEARRTLRRMEGCV